MIQLFNAELNNKRIAYCSESVFKIQLSKGKNKYKTACSFRGNLPMAIWHYNMVNIKAPYNKRLVCFDMNKPILARQKGI